MSHFITRERKEFIYLKQTPGFIWWRREKYKEQRGLCLECLEVMRLPPPNIDKNLFRDDLATVDHILELSEGGKNEYSNFRLICYKCNQAKEREKIRKINDMKRSI